MPETILFPHSLGFEEQCNFSLKVDDFVETDRIKFRTDHVRLFSPTSMIFLAKTCRTRARKFSDEKISYYGLKKHAYANNLGFSDALSLKGKPYPQGAFGGRTYMPISGMRRSALEKIAARRGIQLGDAIQLKCEEIAKVVSQRQSEELQDILAKSFREVFRNVFEHAEIDSAVYCVQYWPSLQQVEICIADRGIGVPNSLGSNPKLGTMASRDALLASLMPGVSSKAWRHKKKKAHQKSEWDNSGFGLFFAHQIFGELGWFAIASCDKALMIQDGGPVREMDCNVEGTLVSMRLDLSDQTRIQGVVDGVRDRAFKVKERIGTKSLDFASIEAFLSKRADF